LLLLRRVLGFLRTGVCGGVGELVILTTRTSSSLSIKSIVSLAAVRFLTPGLLFRGLDVKADSSRAREFARESSLPGEADMVSIR
jgi:hypothetical protein